MTTKTLALVPSSCYPNQFRRSYEIMAYMKTFTAWMTALKYNYCLRFFVYFILDMLPQEWRFRRFYLQYSYYSMDIVDILYTEIHHSLRVITYIASHVSHLYSDGLSQEQKSDSTTRKSYLKGKYFNFHT